MQILGRMFGRETPPTSTPTGSSAERRGPWIQAGALTSRGSGPDPNEDALITLQVMVSQGEELVPLCAGAVADGMGGHAGGQMASDLAVRLVGEWIANRVYRPFLSEPEAPARRQPVSEVLTEAIVAAHGKVHEACPEGGTTLTCALILGSNAFLAHVGDSRAYLISRNTIRRITTDHSLVNRLIELGQITAQEALQHPQRNVLYRALGRPGNLEVDTHLQSLPAQSALLLCTDGLWSAVTEDEMLSTICAAPSPQLACNQLVDRAIGQGSDDNVTALVIRV
jgi:serine/threonine protein phosphatase PrpC